MDSQFRHFTNSLGRIYCSLRYHPDLRMLSVIWKGTAPENAIASLKNEILEMVRENNAVFILSDLEDFFSGATNNLVDLLKADWNKEFFDLGIRQIVHVLKPGSEYAEMYVNKEGPGKQFKFFDNKTDAVLWITEQQQNL